MEHFQRVIPLSELPVGGMKKVVVNYQDLVIVRLEDGVYALSNLCPHARGPQSEERRCSSCRPVCSAYRR